MGIDVRVGLSLHLNSPKFVGKVDNHADINDEFPDPDPNPHLHPNPAGFARAMTPQTPRFRKRNRKRKRGSPTLRVPR